MTKQAIQEIKKNLKPINASMPGAKILNKRIWRLVEDYIDMLDVIEAEKNDDWKRISHEEMKRRLQVA